MILHSIIPMEEIFKNSSSDTMPANFANQDNGSTAVVISYLGEKVEVLRNAQNQYVISRVLSTSPKAYLNPRLMPGSVLIL